MRRARKWLADIYALARIRLAAVGWNRVYGGGLCTFRDQARFFSIAGNKIRSHGQPDLAAIPGQG